MLSVHDWIDYGGSLLEKREANRERSRKAYAKKKASSHGSTRRQRADNAQCTGPERERERDRENRAVDKSTSKSKEPSKFDFAAVARDLKARTS